MNDDSSGHKPALVRPSSTYAPAATVQRPTSKVCDLKLSITRPFKRTPSNRFKLSRVFLFAKTHTHAYLSSRYSGAARSSGNTPKLSSVESPSSYASVATEQDTVSKVLSDTTRRTSPLTTREKGNQQSKCLKLETKMGF